MCSIDGINAAAANIKRSTAHSSGTRSRQKKALEAHL
jgi:hypothetical protein